mmetsp:Transcript_46/g.59  ORF Transcript_46/g.59 Transcript_46/m.59 type:complete len:289 (-) Transcript_46:92-958(-)
MGNRYPLARRIFSAGAAPRQDHRAQQSLAHDRVAPPLLIVVLPRRCLRRPRRRRRQHQFAQQGGPPRRRRRRCRHRLPAPWGHSQQGQGAGRGGGKGQRVGAEQHPRPAPLGPDPVGPARVEPAAALEAQVQQRAAPGGRLGGEPVPDVEDQAPAGPEEEARPEDCHPESRGRGGAPDEGGQLADQPGRGAADEIGHHRSGAGVLLEVKRDHLGQETSGGEGDQGIVAVDRCPHILNVTLQVCGCLYNEASQKEKAKGGNHVSPSEGLFPLATHAASLLHLSVTTRCP